MEGRAYQRELIAVGLLGMTAIDADKRDEEAVCAQRHVILAFIFDTQAMSFAPPEAKLVGTQVLVGGYLQVGRYKNCSRNNYAKTPRKHGVSVRPTCLGQLAAPVDALMAHGGDRSEWIAVPISEIWNACRHSASDIET